jgi:hypothetical protein
MAFVRHDHRAQWWADSSPAPLAMLLLEFATLFEEPTGLPPDRQRAHQIRLLPETAPVAIRPYRYAHVQKAELEWQCVNMLRHGTIHPSCSTFSAPVLLVTKSDGTWRFCVNYRALNARTVKDKFPIPVVEELLDELRGAAFFTKLDLRSGYHQVHMVSEDIEKILFRTHEGLFEFLVMPFRLTNVPTTFQALMNEVLRLFLRKFVLVFFDDILIYSHHAPSTCAMFSWSSRCSWSTGSSSSGPSAPLAPARWRTWATSYPRTTSPWTSSRSRQSSSSR